MTIYNNLNIQSYNFQIPEYSINVGNTIGNSIKDMADGSKTPMVKNNDAQLEEVEKKFQEDAKFHKNKFSELSIKAEAAKSQLGIQRYNKAIAVTLLSVAVIGSIALPITAIVTGAWAVALAAAPFFIGIAPASYFTHIQRKEVSRLEKQIAAPDTLCKPVKEYVAKYNPMQDIDLKSTRLAVINSLSTKALKELGCSEWTTDQMVRYRLLDGFQAASKSNSVPFYNRCITLIEQFKALQSDSNAAKNKINSEFNTERSQSKRWKRNEMNRINGLIRLNAPSPFYGNYKIENPQLHAFIELDKIRQRANLEKDKNSMYKRYVKSKNNELNWKRQSLESIENGFFKVASKLNQDFNALIV